MLDARAQRRLEQWLQEHIPGSSDLRIEAFRPTTVGNSAQTSFFTVFYSDESKSCERDLVMRKEIPGTPVFLDCNICRQADVMHALRRHDVPSACVVGCEEDLTVLGAPFLIMDRVSGRPFPTANYNSAGWVFDLTAADQRRIWQNAVEVIGRLNRIAWRNGFEKLDRRQYGATGLDQYLGWLRAWRTEANGGMFHPFIDPAMDYLWRKKPGSTHVDLVWGDSNPGNMLFADDHSIAAVLDFEAAALGPAEIDLGYWLFMDERRSYGLKRLPGLLSREATISIYESSLGRAVDDLHYYEVLAGVRMSLVIVRTVDRLVHSGRLSKHNRTRICNPIVAALARKLQMTAPEVGDDFDHFSQAVSG
jgi:aminoglycoside phosphotransferase (APT) family kinase protein